MAMARQAERRTGTLQLVLGWLCGLAVAVVLTVTTDRQTQRADDYQARYATSASQAKALGERVAASDVCQSPAPETRAQFGYLCDAARRVAEQSEPDPVDTDALANAVAASILADLPARIDAAVASYLQRNPPPPGQDATPAMVGTAVAEYLTANPPAPGQAATTEQVAAEVAAYFERRPPVAGPPGRPPTQAEIDAAVAAHFQAHPVNACPGVWGPYLYLDGRPGYRCLVPQ